MIQILLLFRVDWSGTHTLRGLNPPPPPRPYQPLRGFLTHPFQVIFPSNNASVVCVCCCVGYLWDCWRECVCHTKATRKAVPLCCHKASGLSRSLAARHISTLWLRRESTVTAQVFPVHSSRLLGYVRGRRTGAELWFTLNLPPLWFSCTQIFGSSLDVSCWLDLQSGLWWRQGGVVRLSGESPPLITYKTSAFE